MRRTARRSRYRRDGERTVTVIPIAIRSGSGGAGICRPGKVRVDIGRRDEERVFEGRAGGCEVLDVLERDAGGIALAGGGADDALVALAGAGGECDGGALRCGVWAISA